MYMCVDDSDVFVCVDDSDVFVDNVYGRSWEFVNIQ